MIDPEGRGSRFDHDCPTFVAEVQPVRGGLTGILGGWAQAQLLLSRFYLAEDEVQQQPFHASVAPPGQRQGLASSQLFLPAAHGQPRRIAVQAFWERNTKAERLT
jgi:hypothetical protein